MTREQGFHEAIQKAAKVAESMERDRSRNELETGWNHACAAIAQAILALHPDTGGGESDKRGEVSAEVYESAVTGRRDFRAAYRAEMDKVRALENQIEGAQRAAIERCAKHFDDKAARHAVHAVWSFPSGARHSGARIAPELHPENGPAIQYDADMKRAAELRALVPLPPSEAKPLPNPDNGRT